MGKRRRIPEVHPDPVRTLHGSLPADTLDLHGLSTDQADVRVRQFMETWRMHRPDTVLRIVTGKGTHSQGPPVLRDRVRELLTGPLSGRVADFVLERGGGSYLIRVR